MAKKRKSTKRRRKGRVGAAFKTATAANKRRYRSIRDGNAVSARVPKACALVQSGANKGKIRKGCYIRKNGAWCDETLLDRLPAQATRKGVTVDCK